MNPDALNQWRKGDRDRLVAARLALDANTLDGLRRRIDAHLEQTFPGLALGGTATLAFCWPYQNEYDPRFLAHWLRQRGVRTALPVVVGPRQPMIFRQWAPGDPLEKGIYDIPYPATGEPVVPEVALVPMNGFDAAGYRLGYGGGFFDRTLAHLRAGGAKRPIVIGVTLEMARIPTIEPQEWDIPMDYVTTELGVYERIEGRLVLLGPPARKHDTPGYSSPACLAHEISLEQRDATGEPPSST